MHFLSHYYTELPENEPLFVVGLCIPDLTNGFAKAYNRKLKNAALPADVPLQNVHRGIMQHFEGDRRFHSSAAFIQEVKDTTHTFVETGLDRNRIRLSVVAHLAVELMIDRQIVRQHPNVCNEYYRIVDSADQTALFSYFNSFGLESEKMVFLERFAFFRQRRFLYLFDELDNIVFGLNRIYSSVTGTGFTESEKERFLTALRNIDGRIRYSWQKILAAE